MAVSRICSIPDCGNNAKTRGWCPAHYTRWLRHGDPLVITKQRGKAREFFQQTVLPYEGDDCLIWPFTRDRQGYGWISWKGRGEGVHRAACREVHGDPRDPSLLAAHSCGKGSEGCCNPRHLRWATPSENEADKLLHGTVARGARQGSSKLCETDIRSIRSLKGMMTQPEIAAQFGIHIQTVYRIQKGDRWGWLD